VGLGVEGAGTAAAVSREILAAWGTRFALDLGSLQVGDDRRGAVRAIRSWCDRDRVDVVLTVGRCGHLPEDYAPEMTAPLLDRPLPGVEERMCLAPPRRPEHLLFRGRAGMRGGALIVNLPARASRVRTIARFLAPVIGHALEKARGSDRECAPPGEGR
jgi:molybdopterin biosynthesis enzyme MoaB